VLVTLLSVALCAVGFDAEACCAVGTSDPWIVHPDFANPARLIQHESDAGNAGRDVAGQGRDSGRGRLGCVSLHSRWSLFVVKIEWSCIGVLVYFFDTGPAFHTVSRSTQANWT
jgi:hypothetical protein